MSRPKQPPWLLCWTATQHDIVRVKSGPRGEPNLRPLLSDMCEVANVAPPQRSAAGGYICHISIVGDLRAYARVHGLWVLVREAKL